MLDVAVGELVSVELTDRLQVRGGGLLLRGEVAAFAPDVAEDLIARGLARAVRKAPEAPPADKMVKRREVTTKVK